MTTVDSSPTPARLAPPVVAPLPPREPLLLELPPMLELPVPLLVPRPPRSPLAAQVQRLVEQLLARAARRRTVRRRQLVGRFRLQLPHRRRALRRLSSTR